MERLKTYFARKFLGQGRYQEIRRDLAALGPLNADPHVTLASMACGTAAESQCQHRRFILSLQFSSTFNLFSGLLCVV